MLQCKIGLTLLRQMRQFHAGPPDLPVLSEKGT
jgi:hypothetical protein